MNTAQILFYASFEKANNYNFSMTYLLGKKYFDIYGNIDEKELVNRIDKANNELEKFFKMIINSSNYKPEILFSGREIKGYLENIILWKHGCFKYKNYFKILENIFIRIKKKDEEMKKIQTIIIQPNNYKNDNNENINNENNLFKHKNQPY